MATAKSIWRDYVTDGVPSSGKNKPKKSEIRAWGTLVEQQTSLINSPLTYDAVGDGVADDSAEFAAAEAASDSIFLAPDAIFNLGAAVPTKPVYGPGAVKIGGVTISGQPENHLAQSNLIWNPLSYSTNVVGPTGSPASAPYFNVILGHDAKDSGDIWRSTVLGSLAATMIEECERSEAIGQGAMRFARYSDRNTAMGTLSMQWIGQQVSALEDYFHDFWIYDPGGGIVPPGDPTWDAFSLETNNPGVGDLIAAVTSAAARTDVAENVGYGRNTLLHLIKGSGNSAGGYNSLAHAYEASNNAAWGRGALRDCVFGNNNAALGHSAGVLHQDGDGNVYLGYRAGEDHVTGDQCIFMGDTAGDGWSGVSRSVLIGPEAGGGVTVASDLLVVQNDTAREPLISGLFAAGKVGINIAPEDMLGALAGLHVRNSAVPGSPTVNSSADDLIVESNGNGGITILTPNNAFGELVFADQDDNNVGAIFYDHTNNEMQLKAGDVVNMSVRSASLGFYGTAAQTKQTVTGSRGGNAALASLLTGLATIGLITNSSTA